MPHMKSIAASNAGRIVSWPRAQRLYSALLYALGLTRLASKAPATAPSSAKCHHFKRPKQRKSIQSGSPTVDITMKMTTVVTARPRTPPLKKLTMPRPLKYASNGERSNEMPVHTSAAAAKPRNASLKHTDGPALGIISARIAPFATELLGAAKWLSEKCRPKLDRRGVVSEIAV